MTTVTLARESATQTPRTRDLAALIAFHAQTATRELTVIRPLRVAAQVKFDTVGLPRGLAKVA